MSLATEYFLLVLCAAIGFIQLAAARARLNGLLLSQQRVLNRVLAGILIAPGAIFFFTWNYRNPVGIIEGSQQAGLFSLATLGAVGVCLVLGSILNRFRSEQRKPCPPSIEALKDRTFFQALLARYKWKR
jgi:hypothetical protein